MHEKMLMLLVFLYILASLRQKKVILRLTSRLIIIKIGPSFLVAFRWSVVHLVPPYVYPLRAVACVIGYVPLPLCTPHAFDPRKPRTRQPTGGSRVLLEEKPQRNPSADGYLCATLACGLMPVAFLLPIASGPFEMPTARNSCRGYGGLWPNACCL
jgi:hypothetical protein